MDGSGQAGRPASAMRPATARALPTEACAVALTAPGSPDGRATLNRLVYSDAYTLPITATPSVPPSRRMASLIAEPTPAWAAGTTPMIASVAGALVRPMPVPSTTIWTAIVA